MTDGRKETNLSSAVEHGSRSSCGQVGAHGPEEVSEDGDPPRRGSRPGTCARGLPAQHVCPPVARTQQGRRDRKSTRLNSSHVAISYAVFCLKKNTSHITETTNENN